MKDIKKIFGLMLLPLIGLASCNEDVSQPPYENPGIHYGVWDDPMSCYQVSLGTSVKGYSAVWVTGYIVGCVNTNISNTCSERTADFSAPGPVQTNILMADNPDEKDWKNCISVQLPSGDARTALNIANAANKGKEVTILGTIGDKYCGVYGVKEVSAYVWGSQGDKSIDIIAKPVVSYLVDLNFLNNGRGFTFEQIKPELTDLQVWNVTEKYGWVAKGMINNAKAETEAMLVSPEFDMTRYSNLVMNIHTAANFFTNQENFTNMCSVLVREVGTTDWTMLTLPNPPSGSSWDFSDSGEIDLSKFDGKKIQIAFRYTSSTSITGTWEIDKLQINGIRK